MKSANLTARTIIFDNNGRVVVSTGNSHETLADHNFVSNYVDAILNTAVTVGGDLSVEGGNITLSTAASTNNFGLPILTFNGGATNYLSLGFTVTGTGHNNDTQALRITRTGSITSTSSITTHSDRSIKTEIEDLDATEAQALFDKVKPKRYKRTDMETDKFRIGFLAQDFISDFAPNLIGEEPKDSLKTLDYGRLTCILWQICKNMQSRIAALEAKGTKKKTTI